MIAGDERTPSPGLPFLRLLVIAVPTALALGIGAELAGYLPYPWNLVSIMGGPWMAAAFLCGRSITRKPWFGALAGVLVIGLGLITDAVFKRLAYGPNSVRVLSEEVPYWIALAIPLGAVLGGVGSGSRREQGSMGAACWGVVLGLILAETIVLIGRGQGNPPTVALIDIGLMGVMAFLGSRWSRPQVFLPVAAVIGLTLAAAWPIARRVFPNI